MKRKFDVAALVILIVSAINLGMIGIFDVNVISWIFGGQTATANRIVYMIVAAAGLWCINLIVVHGRIETAVRDE